MHYESINGLVTVKTKELDALVVYLKKHLDILRQEVAQGIGYWAIDRQLGKQQIHIIDKVYVLSMEMSCLAQQKGYYQFYRKEDIINIKLFDVLLSLIKNPMHLKYYGGDQEFKSPSIDVNPLVKRETIKHSPSIHSEIGIPCNHLSKNTVCVSLPKTE